MTLAAAHIGTKSSCLPQVVMRAPVSLEVAIVPVGKSVGCGVSCSSCSLRQVCLTRGLEGENLDAMDELTRAKRRIAKGAVLYRNGDAFASLYALRSGSFKSICSSRAGDEKVTGLYLPGAVMGLEAINERRHGYDAVALEDSEVCVIPYLQLMQLAHRIPELQTQLLRILSDEISPDHGLMLLMGAMDAEQRIVAFLLSISRRYERLGYAASRFALRMTRHEIGSYLGLTLETVSRVLSRLQRDYLIDAHQKEIVLRDIVALRERAGTW